MDRGTWNGTSWTSSGTGAYVMATVKQSELAYLASVLGFNTINIQSLAIAKVQIAANPCVLALAGQISFQGSPTVNAPSCGLASNDPAANALNFTGGGMTINAGSLSAEGGCTGAATFCSKALTYMPAVTNPFSALDAVTLPTLPICANTSALVAYSAATPCRNNGLTLTGNNTLTLTGGVYFMSGTLQLKGTTAVNKTATFIMLPGSNFDMKGTGTISITANSSVTTSQLPTVLQPYVSLFANMAIYDQSSNAVTFGGSSEISFTRNMYLPNAAVTFQGNPTVNVGGGKSCGELIAASIALNGNATLDSSGCSSATQPTSQYVTLVQ